jgi:hypothetical protein
MSIGPGLCVACKVKLRPKRSDRENAWRSICWGCSEKTRPEKRKKAIAKDGRKKPKHGPGMCPSCKYRPKAKKSGRIDQYRPFCNSCIAFKSGRYKSQRNLKIPPNYNSDFCLKCQVEPRFKKSDNLKQSSRFCKSCIAEKNRTRVNKHTKNLTDYYIKIVIRACGYKGKISKEMIETKRLTLKLHRAIKKFNVK